MNYTIIFILSCTFLHHFAAEHHDFKERFLTHPATQQFADELDLDIPTLRQSAHAYQQSQLHALETALRKQGTAVLDGMGYDAMVDLYITHEQTKLRDEVERMTGRIKHFAALVAKFRRPQ